VVNWDALGAIAELLGAVGVIVTLAYLAVQIRRSNILAVAESHRYSNQVSAASILAVAQDGDLARIFREGLVDRSGLTADDQTRFDMLLSSLIAALSASIMDQMTLGIYGDDRISDQRFSLRLLLSTPGGAAWWNIHRESYPRALQRFVADEAPHPEPPAA
jgi:hypothetical protein